MRILEASLGLFGERGYEKTSLKDIAERAELSVGLVCRYFPTKEHLALAVYDRLAGELAARAPDLTSATLADRFGDAMELKLRSLEPHRRALAALAGRALDPEARAGVLGDAAAPVRARVLGVFALVVSGASDAPRDPREAARLARLCYAAHLAFVILWLQAGPRGLEDTIALARGAGRWIAIANTMAPPELVERAERVFGERLAPPIEPEQRARAILARIFERRRVLPGVEHAPSEAALALHLPRVMDAVVAGRPLRLVLPAFPAKSPSPKKTLGPRADLAEELALRSLSGLLDAIEALHPAGAELVICSDGHVFADLVGVRDTDVARYREDLAAMLVALREPRARLFDLGDALGEGSPARLRAELVLRYAASLEALRERAERSPRHRAQLDGIHRFLVEDAHALRPEESKNRIRKETRAAAYEVVRRSEAWGALVAAAFPDAVRLSIHPQPDVSEKIGVHLVETHDAWLTPWHGCAVLRGERYVLMHRADVEGATLVEEEGRPSHLEVCG
ncbi:MAG: L-tyrosine/L-tryptophan isonitrile synthase family protein [Sandaracinaceae bacterium]|nr:L-tyrosine/L-tryptophan isonitrile synthase family protein [Sandaracinaceae bacterium]